MSKLPTLKGHVTEVESNTDTFNVLLVKALNQETVAFFTLKALGCLLIALLTFYLYIMLKWHTLPNVYWPNCTSDNTILKTLENNISTH
jgi:hypothetical protein